ncbi:MAG: CDP-alcohol phosphatidyltransferase family protein [Clostridia bacterium]|nr:CDP-alcohol phosphatidyltransferase family protein [Clostridia bacterium]
MAESQKQKIWNVPNALTMLRMLLIPVYWALMARGNTYAALAVYVIASLTDLADGYIARKYHLITDFGKLMDPLADKLMVLSVMLSFVLPLGGREAVLPWAPFLILLGKELLMVLGGLILYRLGIVVYSKVIGKVAQLFMVLSLIASFFYRYFDRIGFPLYLYLLYFAVALTLCALAFYGVNAVRLYREKKRTHA